MRILGNPTILAKDIAWRADRFQRNAQGRAGGLWLLGEIGQ